MLELNLRCPGCGNGVFLSPEVGGSSGACSRCARAFRAEHLPPEGALTCCALCGRRDLYRQRDFNRNLGAAIAVGACLGAFVLFVLNAWFWALGVLLAAAAMDLGLYLLLPQVAVCYACGAIHRGFAIGSAIQPYNLLVADAYEKRTGGPTGGH